jgi:membrane glycosyltransferase
MVWLFPVVVSLLLAPFIVAVTSSCQAGEWLARRGMFRTAEDILRFPMTPVRRKAKPYAPPRRAPLNLGKCAYA